MSDALPPERPSAPVPSPSVPGPAQEVEVDLAAFLPEGVQLGDPADLDDEGDVEAHEVDVEELEVVVETDEGIVAVDEVVVTVDDEVVLDEVVAVVVEASERPTVDVEALSQIERDLDAVDAAIAALDAGTYGIDAATGRPIDDALLAEDPTRLS